MLLDLQRPAEALDELRRALGTDPQDPQTHRLCAAVLLQLGAYPDALRAAETSLAIDPYSEWGQRLRSVALSSAGRFKQARAAAWEAVRLAPDEPLAYNNAASLELAPGGDTARAAHAAARALELAPDEVTGHLAVANVELFRKRWRRAEQHLRAALAVDPTDTEALGGLATALRAQGRRVEAVEVFAAVGRAAPAAAPNTALLGTANEHMRGGALGLTLLLIAVIAVSTGTMALALVWAPVHLPALVSSMPRLLLTMLALTSPLVALLVWRGHRRRRQLPAVTKAVARVEARRQNQRLFDSLDVHRPWLAAATLVVSLAVAWVALPWLIRMEGAGPPSRLATLFMLVLVMVPLVSAVKVLRALGRVLRGRPAATPRPPTASAGQAPVTRADALRLTAAEVFEGRHPLRATAYLALGLACAAFGVWQLAAPGDDGWEGYAFTAGAVVAVVVNAIRLLRWGLVRLRSAPFQRADRLSEVADG